MRAPMECHDDHCDESCDDEDDADKDHRGSDKEYFATYLSPSTLFYLTMQNFLYSSPVNPFQSTSLLHCYTSIIYIERHLPFPNHYVLYEPDYQPLFHLHCSPNAICLLRTPSNVSWARFRSHHRRILVQRAQ